MDDAQLAQVREFVVSHFDRGESGVSELFSAECMCAPGYWRRVASPTIVAPQLKNFSIPNRHTGKTYNLDGARLEERSDLKILSRNVASDAGRAPTVRRLSTGEIARLWVVIPFDIEEPLFVVECPARKLVVCLKSAGPAGWRIWWIDAPGEYDYGE
jgi:hypothetical protein